MGQKIPQSFIDDLLSRVDIVDVIDRRVPLKKAGKEYKACCPFHEEKTPSFTVSQPKQFYHCFGCKAHGSAIGFLMEYDRMSFPEAIEELAGMVGLQVPRQQTSEPATPKAAPELFDLMEKTSQYYRHQLKGNDKAIRYLKDRGLSGEIAAAFELGYAPEGWHNLENVMGKSPALREQLEKGGMLIRKDGGDHYDRFRDRIMFPIRDRRGRIIGFGGRVIDQGEPKYLNSPETTIFRKGEELYGLYQARQALRDLDLILVVEGYMDVVSLAQHGVRNAVATLGTAITEQHLNLLMRHTDHVVFCFDGDRAGRQAAWRAAETALPKLSDGLQLRFLFLPEGEDPDTMIRQNGKETFETLVKNALPFTQFFFESLVKQADIRGLDGHAKLIKQARPLLQKISDPAIRQLMQARLAEQLGVAPRDLLDLTASPQAPGRGDSRPNRMAKPPAGRQKTPSAVRAVISMLLHRPDLASLVEDTELLQELQLPGMQLLLQLLELLGQRPNIKIGAILEHWRGSTTGSQLSKLASQGLLVPEEGIEQEFRGALGTLQKQAQEQKLEHLIQKSRYSSLNQEEKMQLNAILSAKAGQT